MSCGHDHFMPPCLVNVSAPCRGIDPRGLCAVRDPVRFTASDINARETRPDVRVRIRSIVVAIDIPEAGIRRVVPIAANTGSAEMRSIPLGLVLVLVTQPAAKHSA